MKSHKVINLLKELSKDDLNKFSKLVNSSYFNHSQKVRDLYFQIIKFYPTFDGKLFTKENIFRKISAKEKFNDSTFRALFHDLLQLFYKFLVVEGIEYDPFSYHIFKIRELNKRRFYKIAKAELDKDIVKLKNKSYDYNLYLNQYFLESFKYNIESVTTKVLNSHQAISLLTQSSKSDSYLLLFFATEIVCDFVNTVVISAKYNLDSRGILSSKIIRLIDLDKLLSECRNNEEAYRILDLYTSLYRLFDNLHNEDCYEIYKEKIEKYENSLSHEERTFHFSNLINYLNIIKNKNNISLHKFKLFAIYEIFLRDELFLDSKINNLNPALFRAILINAIECKKFTWVEQFIDVYINMVPKDFKHNLLNYAYSLFYYEIGKNIEALECLDRINLDNFMFKFDSYNTRLKIYFEYENPQKALDYIHSYSEFIRKDKFLSENRKIAYKTFINYAKDLISCKEDKSNYDIDFVKKQIEKNSNVLNKEWLLNKATQILESKKPFGGINVA